ncbi:epithelial cell adhesion molecule [Pholidichthys leucotaenia]
MNVLIVVAFAALAAGAAHGCVCNTMKWATCDPSPCRCYAKLDSGETINLNCSELIPKCHLMKIEMSRSRLGQTTRTNIGGKQHEHAFVDNDGIYDPECENNGNFRAKQCNGTEECWCVNSAGVRRSDKGDKDIKCEKVVETYWVRLLLTHEKTDSPVDKSQLKDAIAYAINKRYKNFNKALISGVNYDPEARLIVVDVQKPKGEQQTDLSRMAYYMEKDVKVKPLFRNENENFEPTVGTQKLKMEKILVYYLDEEKPTFTMKHLTGGIIAVIVVVSVLVVAGLLGLFLYAKKHKRYDKAQQREMDRM